jgi:hypothetical protein
VALPAGFPAVFAGDDGADHATPAVRSNAKPAVIDVRSLMSLDNLDSQCFAAPIYTAKGAIRQ